MKLNVAKAEDRDTLCVILCRNGYTVRQRKRGTMPAPFGGRIMVPLLDPSQQPEPRHRSWHSRAEKYFFTGEASKKMD